VAKAKAAATKRKSAAPTKAKPARAGATRRRAYEYDHQYGLSPSGPATPKKKT
jgi:hypothetical protein